MAVSKTTTSGKIAVWNLLFTWTFCISFLYTIARSPTLAVLSACISSMVSNNFTSPDPPSCGTFTVTVPKPV